MILKMKDSFFKLTSIPIQFIYAKPILTKNSIRKQKNLKKNLCQECEKKPKNVMIEIGEFIWHQECLTCDLCLGKIFNNEFIFLNNNLFHENCFKEIQGPFCNCCSNSCYGEEILLINNKTYHKNCLRCSFCQNNIYQNDIIDEINDLPICKECSNKIKKKCLICNESVNNSKKILYSGSVYYLHNSCCNCSICSIDLNQNNFIYEKNFLYCKNCWYNLSNYLCFNCNEPVHPIERIFFNNLFHNNCFKCHFCDINLSNDNPILFNNNIFCKRCFNSKDKYCFNCKREINDNIIIFENFSFHYKCFKCKKCDLKLREKETILTKNILLCQNCFIK